MAQSVESLRKDLKKEGYSDAKIEKMTEAWESREDLAGMMLNSMAGFRLALYNRRGWESPLYEPLQITRMTQKTLDTMWDVVSKNVERLKPYIEA